MESGNRAFIIGELGIIGAANAQIDKADEKLDRVAQTIDRLISNLPGAIIKLKAMGLTSLSRQIQNDLDNLVYWQKQGGLKGVEADNEN